MRKEDKYTVIEEIGNALKEYSCVYLAETTGLNAEKTSALRRACFKSDVKLMVVKNTLLHKAMEASEVDYSGLYPALEGPTSLLLSNTGNAPANSGHRPPVSFCSFFRFISRTCSRGIYTHIAF